MNQEQAFQIIEQALNAATTKGVFNLQDTANILGALTTIKNSLENPVTEKEVTLSK